MAQDIAHKEDNLHRIRHSLAHARAGCTRPPPCPRSASGRPSMIIFTTIYMSEEALEKTFLRREAYEADH